MPRIRAQKKTASPAAVQPDSPADESASVAVADEPRPVVDQPQPVKRKTAPPPPASGLLAGEIEREKHLAMAREELVFRRHVLLADGQDLSVDEFRLLRTAIPKPANQTDFAWKEAFELYLRREIGRVGRILDLQNQAGTPTDRSTADKLAEQTQGKLESEAPGIEAEILELQSKLQSLRQAATEKNAAADARHTAVVDLRDEKLLPPFVRDELNAIRRGHEIDFGGELRNLEARRSQILVTLARDPENNAEDRESVKHHVSGNPRFGADQFERLRWMFQCEEWSDGPNRHFRVEKLRRDRWEAYCVELRQELGDVEGRISTIASGPQSAASKEMERLRSYYVPG